jgi:hypothetical protein
MVSAKPGDRSGSFSHLPPASTYILVHWVEYEPMTLRIGTSSLTTRPVGAAYSNMYISFAAEADCLCTVGGKMAKLYLSQLPTNSLWLECFALGCLCRMGQDICPNWAIMLNAMHTLLDALDNE